jgi:hypothetical protein
MESKRIVKYAIKTPQSKLIHNILECNESWAWAVFYSRQKWARKEVPPSKIPPDFITCLKSQGYKAIQMIEEL